MTEGPVELPDSYRPQASGARRIGDPSPDAEVEVTVTLRGPQLPTADAVTGPPVDPGAFAAAYGADADDAAKVKEELEKLGLQVYDVSLAGRSLHARGTVQQLRSAFGVSFGLYESDDQGQFRGREGSISVPAPLAGIITGVFGLDDRRMARRKNAPAPAAQAGPLSPRPTSNPATSSPKAMRRGRPSPSPSSAAPISPPMCRPSARNTAVVSRKSRRYPPASR